MRSCLGPPKAGKGGGCGGGEQGGRDVGGGGVADDGCSLETPTTAAALTGTPDLPPL